MATGDARKTISQGSKPARQRETSISAHVVRMGCVTMAFAELDTLCDILAHARRDDGMPVILTPGENAVVTEFIEAVESIR